LLNEAYTTFGGRHDETAAMHNILASQGVMAPHTGDPLSEAMLLGVGGGLGGGYHVFQYGAESTFFVGLRGFWDKPNGELSRRILTRLGGRLEVRETTGKKSAATHLMEPLSAGKPVLVWVDPGGLPYLGHLGSLYVFHVVAACGYDADTDEVLIDDLAPAPWRVCAADLATARTMVSSQKNRTAQVMPPTGAFDLKAAVRAGIEDCVAELTSPRRTTMGLAAFSKWADLIAGSKAKKSWARVFESGPNLFQALRGTHYWIETAETGTGGGAFRGMYADFLTEAADLLDAPRLLEVAADYRRLAELWTALAESALPESVKPLAEYRKLLLRKQQLIVSKGPAALDEVRRTQTDLRKLGEQLRDDFPLTSAEAEAVREGMQGQITAIHATEQEAVARLGSVLS